ncbi:MAG TPA: hypothetical protein PLE19_14925 [Planctomycetota bacterium]|nr:hypothetical protein [Planctomycetota bacterium]
MILGVEPNLSYERPDHPPLLVNRPFLHHVRERAQHLDDRAHGLVEVHVRACGPLQFLDLRGDVHQFLLEFGDALVGELAVLPRQVVQDVVDLRSDLFPLLAQAEELL